MRFVWSFFPLFLLGCRGSEIDGKIVEFDQLIKDSINDPTLVPVIFFIVFGFLAFIFIFPAMMGFYYGLLTAMRFTGLIIAVCSPLYYVAGGRLDTSIAMGIAGIMGAALPLLFGTCSPKNKKAEEDEEEETDKGDG